MIGREVRKKGVGRKKTIQKMKKRRKKKKVPSQGLVRCFLM